MSIKEIPKAKGMTKVQTLEFRIGELEDMLKYVRLVVEDNRMGLARKLEEIDLLTTNMLEH